MFLNTRVRRVFKAKMYNAAKVLSAKEKSAIELVDECGMPLFHSESSLNRTIVVRQKLTCSSHIEVQYYSAKLIKLPAICYWCGGAQETLVYDEDYTQLQREFKVVRPICISEGKQAFTS